MGEREEATGSTPARARAASDKELAVFSSVAEATTHGYHHRQSRPLRRPMQTVALPPDARRLLPQVGHDDIGHDVVLVAASRSFRLVRRILLLTTHCAAYPPRSARCDRASVPVSWSPSSNPLGTTIPPHTAVACPPHLAPFAFDVVLAAPPPPPTFLHGVGIAAATLPVPLSPQ